MKGSPNKNQACLGYCLAEVMMVLALLAICMAVGSIHFSGVLRVQQARASAQSTQAAVAWAQTGVLWEGERREVSVDTQGLSLSDASDSPEGTLGSLVPTASATSNVVRWNTTDGFTLALTSPSASPDSGGSLFFGPVGSSGWLYRVSVRPESGLTVREWITR